MRTTYTISWLTSMWGPQAIALSLTIATFANPSGPPGQNRYLPEVHLPKLPV